VQLFLGEAEVLPLPGSVFGAAVSFGQAQRVRRPLLALPVSAQPLYVRVGINSGTFIGPVESVRAEYCMQSILGSLERQRIAGLRHRVPDRSCRSAAQ